MAFLNDLAARLVAQGVGTIGATSAGVTGIFLGSNAKLPELGQGNGDGPFIVLIQTGGLSPMFVHNYAGAHVRRPSAQVGVRGTKWSTVSPKAEAAYAALNGIWNTTINGVFYQKIVAIQEPTDAGHDGDGRLMMVFNVATEKQP